MKTFVQAIIGLAAALLSLSAMATLNVFTCEPEWAALANEVGRDKVSPFSATTAFQDPHYIQARPSLIARARNADILICTGSELEIGWLPLLLTQSGNARIQQGTPGHLEASLHVLRIDVPRVVDRSLGDIHAGGNPHIQTDPRNIGKISAVLASRLAQLDPANAPIYKSNQKAFEKRWSEAIARWEKDALPLKGVPVLVHHKDLSYLIAWLGMREVGSLEPKPGIPPTTSHLAALVEQMKRAPAKLILYSSHSDPRASEFLSSRTGIPRVMLPITVGGTDRAKDLFGYFDDLIGRLRGALK